MPSFKLRGLFSRRLKDYEPKQVHVSPGAVMNSEIRDLPEDVLQDFYNGFSDPVSLDQQTVITEQAHHILHVGAIKIRKHKIDLAAPIIVAATCFLLLIMSLLGVPSDLAGKLGNSAVSQAKKSVTQMGDALKESARQIATPTPTSSPQAPQKKPEAAKPVPKKSARPKPVPTTNAADRKTIEDGTATLNRLGNAFDNLLAILALIGMAVCVFWFLGRYLFWRWAYIALSMQEGVEMVYRTLWPERSDNDMIGFSGLSMRDRAMFGLPPEESKKKSGFFTRHNEGSEFDAINDVNFKASFLGQILGYGNKVVFDTAGSLANLSMDHIPDPDSIKAVVLLVKRTIEYDRMMDQSDVHQEQIDQTYGVHGQLVKLNSSITTQGRRHEELMALLLANRQPDTSSNTRPVPVNEPDQQSDKKPDQEPEE